MDANFFTESLYPFQDQVLDIVTRLETGFYLTGGTAASRGYLNHRFSEDLDFFVVLLTANKSDWELIRWLNPPKPAQFVRDLHQIGEKIILPSG